MKTLYLVAESLPMKVGTICEGLDSQLHPFDLRHGVFPNLVAKPLMATLNWLLIQNLEIEGLTQQLPTLLEAESSCRFNVYNAKRTNDKFKFSPKFFRRLKDHNPESDLWLIYGVQTCFGVLGYLLGDLKGNRKYPRKDIRDTGKKFLVEVSKVKEKPEWFPKSIPRQLCAQLGLYHRLCTERDSDADIIVNCLETAIKKYRKEYSIKGSMSVEYIVNFVRSIVPLMHNEAYQDRYDTGYNQAHFVSGTSIKTNKTPQRLYWNMMGEAIGTRLQGEFVSRSIKNNGT